MITHTLTPLAFLIFIRNMRLLVDTPRIHPLGPLGRPQSGVHLGVIELKRRSVQSYSGINFFLLEESGFYDARK